jgi:hypothetical protein
MAGGGFGSGGGKRKVLARGTTSVVHAGAGAITTNVDVSAYGLPAITSCVEKYLGHRWGTFGTSGYHARIRLTSSTNLEIVTRAWAAITVYVSWEILEALGTVQRGTVDIVANNNFVKSDITISSVNMDTAEAFNNGVTPSIGINDPPYFSLLLTSQTNLESYGGAVSAMTVTGAWAIDGG